MRFATAMTALLADDRIDAMTRSTPPRPIDIAAVFPDMVPLARSAVRLHPRHGTPTVRDSSVGGPLLWPADEPWPLCAADVDAHQLCTSPLVAVAQLYLRDVPGPCGPQGADVLQVLWCPQEGEDGLPATRLVWRDSGAVGEVLPRSPSLARTRRRSTSPRRASCIRNR